MPLCSRWTLFKGPERVITQHEDGYHVQGQPCDVGAIPVCDGTRLQGMITDRDIVVRIIAEKRQPDTATVQDAMTPHVLYCYEDQDVEEAARLMQSEQIRRLPILNREKQLVGIVSLGDVAVKTHAPETAGKTLEGVSQK